MQIISMLVLLLCVLRVDPNEEHMMLCLLNLIRLTSHLSCGVIT